MIITTAAAIIPPRVANVSEKLQYDKTFPIDGDENHSLAIRVEDRKKKNEQNLTSNINNAVKTFRCRFRMYVEEDDQASFL